jgi:hypothetical protein
MMLPERRYDIDWLRVIAIGLLIIYHIGIGFQPWGVFIGFIQNEKPLEWLCLENTFVILCFGHGGLLCHEKKELETIDTGKNKEDICPIHLWHFLYCSCARYPLAEILFPGNNLLTRHCTLMVPGQYFHLCADVITTFLFSEKE